jgi:hypothetical protein
MSFIYFYNNLLKIKERMMIREILRPSSNNFTISIPNEYINQEIELIIFPLNSNNKIEKKIQ